MAGQAAGGEEISRCDPMAFISPKQPFKAVLMQGPVGCVRACICEQRNLTMGGRACSDISHIACCVMRCSSSTFRVRERLQQRRVSALAGRPSWPAEHLPSQLHQATSQLPPQLFVSASQGPKVIWVWGVGPVGRAGRPSHGGLFGFTSTQRQHSVGRPGFLRRWATRVARPARQGASMWGARRARQDSVTER
jgi:hypothetical protein